MDLWPMAEALPWVGLATPTLAALVAVWRFGAVMVKLTRLLTQVEAQVSANTREIARIDQHGTRALATNLTDIRLLIAEVRELVARIDERTAPQPPPLI